MVLQWSSAALVVLLLAVGTTSLPLNEEQAGQQQAGSLCCDENEAQQLQAQMLLQGPSSNGWGPQQLRPSLARSVGDVTVPELSQQQLDYLDNGGLPYRDMDYMDELNTLLAASNSGALDPDAPTLEAGASRGRPAKRAHGIGSRRISSGIIGNAIDKAPSRTLAAGMVGRSLSSNNLAGNKIGSGFGRTLSSGSLGRRLISSNLGSNLGRSLGSSHSSNDNSDSGTNLNSSNLSQSPSSGDNAPNMGRSLSSSSLGSRLGSRLGSSLGSSLGSRLGSSSLGHNLGSGTLGDGSRLSGGGQGLRGRGLSLSIDASMQVLRQALLFKSAMLKQREALSRARQNHEYLQTIGKRSIQPSNTKYDSRH